MARNHLSTLWIDKDQQFGPYYNVMERLEMDLADPAYPALSGQPLTQAKHVDGGMTNRVPRTNLKRVFLISWSGMNRSTLRERMAANPSRFPNLHRLKGDGGWIDIDITRALKDLPNNALPGNDPVAGTVNLLTGYDFDLTGCYNHDRLAQLPLGWTVFERFKDYFPGQNEYADSLVYVTSPAGFSRQDAPQPQPFGDNGFDHQQGAFVFLVTNDGKIREGYGNPLRIAPTLLKSFGIPTGRTSPRYSKHLRKDLDWDIIRND
jgi:hypothetical protein